MSKYIETATDLNVEGVEFFVKEEADGYLYEDESCENKVNYETLKHAFEMNDIVIIDNGVAYRAIGLSVSEGVVTVTYITVADDNGSLISTPKQVVSYDEPVSNSEETNNFTEPSYNEDDDDDDEPEQTTTPPGGVVNGGNDTHPTDPTP